LHAGSDSVSWERGTECGTGIGTNSKEPRGASEEGVGVTSHADG